MAFDDGGAADGSSKPMMLDITAQKGDNIFVSDQTPTPTRLIKNCEEVGLFEDLCRVNPFDETFRRAVEQNVGSTRSSQPGDHAARSASIVVEDTLHTPQVFPQLEAGADDSYQNCDMDSRPIDRSISVDDLLADGNSLFKLSTSRQNSANSTNSSTTQSAVERTNKYRPIAEKPQVASDTTAQCTLPPPLQMIQPQVITWSIGTQSLTNSSVAKPYILPKTVNGTKPKSVVVPSSSSSWPSSLSHHVNYTANEPSSASMTPTSQLPIKERLKAILNNHSKAQQVERKSRQIKLLSRSRSKSEVKREDDCLERRRAAASRYRNKVRNEFKELRQRNNDLAAENAKLRQCIAELSEELRRRSSNVTLTQQQQPQQQPAVATTVNVPYQIQLPASTLQLVMTIPPIVVPSNGPPTLQHPISYTMEKK